MTISRRSFFGMAAASVVLAGCTITRDGTTTKLTLDVDKIKNYAQAGINAVGLISTSLALFPGFSVLSGNILKISESLKDDLNSFTIAVGGAIEIVYDDANYKTIIDSIVKNLDSLYYAIDAIVSTVGFNTGIGTDVSNKLNLIRQATLVVVSAINTLVGGFLTTAAGYTEMTEPDALSVLNVH